MNPKSSSDILIGLRSRGGPVRRRLAGVFNTQRRRAVDVIGYGIAACALTAGVFDVISLGLGVLLGVAAGVLIVVFDLYAGTFEPADRGSIIQLAKLDRTTSCIELRNAIARLSKEQGFITKGQAKQLLAAGEAWDYEDALNELGISDPPKPEGYKPPEDWRDRRGTKPERSIAAGKDVSLRSATGG